MGAGYRIEYGEYASYRNRRHRGKTVRILAAMSICGLLAFLCLYPPTAKIAREAMIPGNDIVTLNAIDRLTDALDGGAALTEAFAVFCDTVINVE